MITSVFLSIIYGLVYALASPLRLLADVVVNADFAAAISSVGSYIKAVDNFIPTATILIILGLVLSIDTSIFAYKGIMWVVKRFPTQS